MRIGIVPFLHRDCGGSYQYSLTMLAAVYEWKCQGWPDDFVVFAHEFENPALAHFPKRSGWTLVPLWSDEWLQKVTASAGLPDDAGAVSEASAESALPGIPDPEVVRHDTLWERYLAQWPVEFMIHQGPGAMPFEVDIPYVMAVHDLQHRLQPEFPEVSAHGEWHIREHYYRNACRYATMILVDSEVGKEQVLHYYGWLGIDAERVQVLPFLPASYLRPDITGNEAQRVRAKYWLPERYLFLPAQLWPHKNHARVIQALALLKQHGLRVPLVCCGSAADSFRQAALADVHELVRNAQIQDQVQFLGYVPDRDMIGLYAAADALIFPTFFGPTNIPPLEAWIMGCPVITSDIRGMREQMGDAAILVDPRSVEAIAAGIERLWQDPYLRTTLIERGRARAASYTPQHYSRRLKEIVEQAKALVSMGATPHVPREQ
jgi:glycosyltransferase involved in cell wall biosynthesis